MIMSDLLNAAAEEVDATTDSIALGIVSEL